MSKIVRIEADFFRGLASARWSFSGVCALVGPNGAGKSTLLQVPAILRTALDHELSTGIQEFGGLYGTRNLEAPQRTETRLSFGVDGDAWELTVPPTPAQIDDASRERAIEQGRNVYQRRGRTGNWQADGKEYDGPLAALRHMFDKKQFLAHVVEALRSYRLRRRYDVDTLRASGSPAGGDVELDALGRNCFTVLRNWRDKHATQGRYERVREGLKRLFPSEFTDFEFEVAGNVVAARFAKGLKESLLASAVSDGLLLTTLHLTAVASCDAGGILAFDEIENSLHPAAIRSLVAVLREWAAEKGSHVLLATHSPVVIDEFKQEPENVFVIEREQQSVPTRLTDLLDKDWLGHFSLGDLFSHKEFGAPRAAE